VFLFTLVGSLGFYSTHLVAPRTLDHLAIGPLRLVLVPIGKRRGLETNPSPLPWKRLCLQLVRRIRSSYTPHSKSVKYPSKVSFVKHPSKILHVYRHSSHSISFNRWIKERRIRTPLPRFLKRLEFGVTKNDKGNIQMLFPDQREGKV
jgi:hypothetical protein